MKTRQPSTNDIKAAVDRSKSEYIDSIPRKIKETGLHFKIEEYKKLRNEYGLEKIPEDSEKIDKENIRQLQRLLIAYQKACPPESKITEFVNDRTKHKTSRDLVTHGNKKKKIPIVMDEYEDVGKKEKKHYLLISIEFLKQDFSGILKKALKRFNHFAARDSKIITGFPYEHKFDNKKEPVQLYQLFQTFNIKNNPKRYLIYRQRTAVQEVDFKMLCNYSTTEIGKASKLSNMKKFFDLPLSQRAEEILVDRDLDECMIVNYHYMHGYAADETTDRVFPWAARCKISEIRATDPRFRHTNNLIMRSYPDDLVENVVQRVKDDDKAGIIEHMQKKLKLHISQVEHAKRLPHDTISNMTTQQFKDIPIDPNFDYERSQFIVPITRTISGCSADAVVRNAVQGPKIVMDYEERINRLDKWKAVKRIRPDFEYKDEEEESDSESDTNCIEEESDEEEDEGYDQGSPMQTNQMQQRIYHTDNNNEEEEGYENESGTDQKDMNDVGEDSGVSDYENARPSYANKRKFGVK
jgi:hypothetical protein